MGLRAALGCHGIAYLPSMPLSWGATAIPYTWRSGPIPTWTPTTDSNNSDWAPLVPAGGTTFDASAIVSAACLRRGSNIPNLNANKITSGTLGHGAASRTCQPAG